jgi:hypothetical protein
MGKKYNVTDEYYLNEIKLKNILKSIEYYPGDKPELFTVQRTNGPVLDGYEFLRIKNSLSTEDQLKQKIRQNEKEYLHKRSQERIKNWHNTITGQRRMKDEIRKKKLEEQEEQKRKENEIYIENEKRKREETLEKMKQIRIQELDSVKAFNIKLRHFEALKERKLQIENKKLRQRIQEEYDKQIDIHFNEIKKAEAEEDRLKLNEKLKAAKIVDDYNQALREKRKIENALIKQESLKEHERAVQKDLEDKEEEKVEKAKEKEKLKELFKNIKEKEIDNKIKKEKEILIDEQIKKEVEVFLEKKEKQNELRQQREVELRNKNNVNKEKIFELIENDNEKKKKKIEDFQAKWLNVVDNQAKIEEERAKKDAQFKKELYQAYLDKREEKKNKKELKKKQSLELSKLLKEYDECTRKMDQYVQDKKKLEIEKLGELNKILKEEQSERRKKDKEERNSWRQLIKEKQDLDRKYYEDYIKSVANESWTKDNEPLQRYIKGQLNPDVINNSNGSGNRRFMYGNLHLVNTWERLGITEGYKHNDLKLSSEVVGDHDEYLKDVEQKKYVPINYESKDFH